MKHHNQHLIGKRFKVRKIKRRRLTPETPEVLRILQKIELDNQVYPNVS